MPRPSQARACAALLALAALLPVIGTGCAAARGRRSGPGADYLSAEERYRDGIAWLNRRRLTRAVSSLSKIYQYTPENRAALEPLVRLGLADATFYQNNDIAWIDARSMYLDFVTLYSDHKLAAYAQFQSGVCSLKQVRHPSRDQTETRQAIEDLKETERLYPGSTYAAAARLKANEAEARLADHEILVGRFYVTKKKYLAAVERFKTALERYPHYPEKDKLYFLLGDSLVRANNPEEGRLYLDKLVQDYPDGKYAEPARKALAQVREEAEPTAPGTPTPVQDGS